MKRQSPSIFNDIIGPVMTGPSSSHTCGPSRIGFLARQFIGGELKKVEIVFAAKGSYPKTYKGQGSDVGFVNGLLGRKPEDPDFNNAFKVAQEKGIEISFVIKDFESDIPNLAIIHLESTCGERAVIHSDSTGGGTVRLIKHDEFEINMVGDCYELLVYTLNGSSSIAEMFAENEGIIYSRSNGRSVLNIKQRTPVPSELIDKIKNMSGVFDVKVIEPVLTIPSNRNVPVPFSTAAELLELAEKRNCEIWELAVEYECARSGWNEEEVMRYTDRIIDIMRDSVSNALEGNIDMNGILQPTAGKIFHNYKNNGKWLDMGLLNLAVPYSMAAMEYNSARGVVICAPTGGSAGVFPGAVFSVADSLGETRETIRKALLTTAIVGVLINKDGFSAELYGCQIEPGAASAMAAAGLVFLAGGTPRQSLYAASAAIQNILGTICDPVAGLVQVPCISRNAMSVANAFVCANMVIGGYDPLIPLDESTETLFRVGSQLPTELRCTCNGGLCVTPTGKRLAMEQEARFNSRCSR